MCARDDDPSTYDAVRREQVRRAAVTRDGTQLDTSPGWHAPDGHNKGKGHYSPGSARWVAGQPGYLPPPGTAVAAPGTPTPALYPSFIMVTGWHMWHGTYWNGQLDDKPTEWLALGWCKLSLWSRDPEADVYDAEFELVPLLNKALPQWTRNCPECDGLVYSALDLLTHLNAVHFWSLYALEAWMRLANEMRIVLPQEGDAVDAAE